MKVTVTSVKLRTYDWLVTLEDTKGTRIELAVYEKELSLYAPGSKFDMSLTQITK